jgi:transposase
MTSKKFGGNMAQKRIGMRKIREVLRLHFEARISQAKIAGVFRISRHTVQQYIMRFTAAGLIWPLDLRDDELERKLFSGNIGKSNRPEPDYLYLSQEIRKPYATLAVLWEEYKEKHPNGYEYSYFCDLFNAYCKKNGFSKIKFNKYQIRDIPREDEITLRKWRLSNNKNKWQRAIALLALHKGCNIKKISNKIERSCRTIKKWHAAYIDNGLTHLDLNRTRIIPARMIDNINLKKERIIKLIHESPSLHDINRTSWDLRSLTQAYGKVYNETICKTSISEYIRSEGYTFKKARTVLTSPDPEYRIKLKKITNILSNLKTNEKFFSIDEFGPAAIKIRGGRTYSSKDQSATIPQFQKSKGSLICTAALELSTNQVTHFYSNKKNTAEMIRLLDILIDKYSTEERIFFSWDAASWHASKRLYERVKEVNEPEYRNKHNSPFVELAPLPSSAQFLNVIESVFSGMAKAVIHNSDYRSVDECKFAIDRYFSERNQEFLKNPKRAGKKIWGEEIVKAVFKDSNNCKDPKYR